MKYDEEDLTVFPQVAFPELSDESVWEIHEYLQCLLEAFESNYLGQLKRYQQNYRKPEMPDWMFDGEGVPF